LGEHVKAHTTLSQAEAHDAHLSNMPRNAFRAASTNSPGAVVAQQLLSWKCSQVLCVLAVGKLCPTALHSGELHWSNNKQMFEVPSKSPSKRDTSDVQHSLQAGGPGMNGEGTPLAVS